VDNKFKLISPFKPAGDQPEAIKELIHGVKNGNGHQVLLGVTGSGKTFVVANLIEKLQKPTLIISPNKILAAQLYAEFKAFFPENAVEYFVSYYDYYQPEAYIPQSDTYIEKDSSINENIERLRLKATSSVFERKDVIVVASVSCIYSLGSPDEYKEMCVILKEGQNFSREKLINELIAGRYQRGDFDFKRGSFRVKGDTIEIFPAYLETALRVEFFGDQIERISEVNPIDGKVITRKDNAYIFPASHFVISLPKIESALKSIEQEMHQSVAKFKSEGKLIEAQRIEQRVRYDMELMKETGICPGIENYSRQLSGRAAGSRPYTLIDYFRSSSGSTDDFLMIIDESHIGIPQIRGMYEGDKSRKQTLVNFGFRLPSALDNRPLKFNEFEGLCGQSVYVSATPGPYELNKTAGEFVELVIRPTGLVDPEVVIKPIKNQIEDLIMELKNCVAKKTRALITTLTKRLSEDLCAYLKEKGFKVEYLHSEIVALKRIEILRRLRLGEFDILVGINLLREGLDLPEVALVAVLDADKEGFLRSETTLIQVSGRAARNSQGRVILYADKITGSMQRAIAEMDRRRSKQEKHNKLHGITPKTIIKAIHKLEEFSETAKKDALKNIYAIDPSQIITPSNASKVIKKLEEEMLSAADILDFETAAILRDRISEINQMTASTPKDKARK